jgi:hypothetical protein
MKLTEVVDGRVFLGKEGSMTSVASDISFTSYLSAARHLSMSSCSS